MTKLEWILGGVLIVLLVIVAGLAFSLWVQPNFSSGPEAVLAEVAPTPVYEGQTAMAAAAAAKTQAQNWQPDATLYKASATWGQTLNDDLLSSGASAWSFTYYSPASQSLATITVTDNAPSAITAGPQNLQLTPRDIIGGWKVDSAEAVRILLEQGGQDFLAREGVTSMVMTLTTDNENGRIEWLIGLFAPQTEDTLALRLDATSGEILEIIQSP